MTEAIEHLREIAMGEMADAVGDVERLSDLICALVATLGIAIATQANGSPRVASFLCERATDLLFTTVAENEQFVLLALRSR
ncbi:hypothetical protein [Methylobacterium oxalidis]|uniref:hypothetical protein n=1 Tax=Methylobacterium oxalidis TaxID=944322 RepID=UPI003314C43B